MATTTATRVNSAATVHPLEVILRETLKGIEESERHFEDLARQVDTRTGEGKRLQQTWLSRRQDYATQGDGLRMVLSKWERSEAQSKAAGA